MSKLIYLLIIALVFSNTMDLTNALFMLNEFCYLPRGSLLYKHYFNFRYLSCSNIAVWGGMVQYDSGFRYDSSNHCWSLSEKVYLSAPIRNECVYMKITYWQCHEHYWFAMTDLLLVTLWIFLCRLGVSSSWACYLLLCWSGLLPYGFFLLVPWEDVVFGPPYHLSFMQRPLLAFLLCTAWI